MNIPTYTLVRTRRRSLALQIDTSANIIVRAPLRMPIFAIEDFIEKKKNWIQQHQYRILSTPKKENPNTDEILLRKKKLKQWIIPRIQELGAGKNLPKIESIKITKSERRWGSCSNKNGLCFSYRLFEYIDTPFIDAIIIHELAHLREKNHQKPFWNLVYTWMPEYESIIKNEAC